jgi:hypothetical protein
MLHVTLCAKAFPTTRLTFEPACSSKSAIMPQLHRAREAESLRSITRYTHKVSPSSLRTRVPALGSPPSDRNLHHSSHTPRSSSREGGNVKCVSAAENFLCMGHLTPDLAPAKAFRTSMRRVVDPLKEAASRLITPDHGCSERKQAQRSVFWKRRLGYERRIASC